MNNKNIVEICLSGSLGGLEISAANCFEYFKDKTNCYVVVAPDTKLDNFITHKNKFTIKRNKFFPFIPALTLAKFIDGKDIDIIHFHWGKDIATAILAKLFSKKKPKIIHSRHMNMTRFKNDIYHIWLYKNIDMLHAVSRGVKEQLEKYIPSSIRPPVEVIYLGTKECTVDIKKVESLRTKYSIKDEFVVGIVGRICEDKGQYIVIEALNRLKSLNIKALIIGHTTSDDYLQSLKGILRSLNLEDRVIFSGFTKDVNEHIKLCDVTVLASYKETFGLVVLESMINKVCAIVTNRGGPLEIIDDGVNGLLFDRSSEDLASKIDYLYNNPDKKASMANAGYEKAKREFDYDTQMQKLYNMVQSL